mgnify:FL=1
MNVQHLGVYVLFDLNTLTHSFTHPIMHSIQVLKNRTPWIALGLGVSEDSEKKVLTLVRPNSGVLRNERKVLFPYTYHPSPEMVAENWMKIYQESASMCHHGPKCKQGTNGGNCDMGMRFRTLCLISGA